MTVAIVGQRPTDAQLRKLFGARRGRILELSDFQRDVNNQLAGKHVLFHRAQTSPENLATFPRGGGVPPAILKSVIETADPSKSRQKARSTYVPDNREVEVAVTADENAIGNDTDAAFVMDNIGVIPSGEDISQRGGRTV